MPLPVPHHVWGAAFALAAVWVAAPAWAQAPAALPSDAGQVWREYDLRPYTSRVNDTAKPEQAVVDWILRETGVEVWFSAPLGILSASQDKLTVYHTPEMQRVVADVVDRFVHGGAHAHVYGVRVVTIGSPNWRTTAEKLMRPVPVQTPGVSAWLLTKENAALLLAELSRRSDFRQFASPTLVAANGQSLAVTARRPRTYVKGTRPPVSGAFGQEPEMGQVDEGFGLAVSPLLSQDGRTVDAVVKCEVDQVERLVSVPQEGAGPLGAVRLEVQTPQVASWRLHERFRWPADQVLLISAGVGPALSPEPGLGLGLLNPLASGPARADALLLIEHQGEASQALLDAAPGGGLPSYRGRY